MDSQVYAYQVKTDSPPADNSQDAFHFCENLHQIDIPSTIMAIENFTSESCESLEAVSIPNTVKSIGEYAFSFTALNTITLTESLRETRSKEYEK